MAKSLGYAYRTVSHAIARGEFVLDKATERTLGGLLGWVRPAPMARISNKPIKGLVDLEYCFIYVLREEKVIILSCRYHYSKK